MPKTVVGSSSALSDRAVLSTSSSCGPRLQLHQFGGQVDLRTSECNGDWASLFR
jgi:hypothetical protein